MSIIDQILSSNNLTTYKAGQVIAAKTGQSPNAVRVRLDQWCKEMPKSWVMIKQYLAILGYEVVIKRKR